MVHTSEANRGYAERLGNESLASLLLLGYRLSIPAAAAACRWYFLASR